MVPSTSYSFPVAGAELGAPREEGAVGDPDRRVLGALVGLGRVKSQIDAIRANRADGIDHGDLPLGDAPDDLPDGSGLAVDQAHDGALVGGQAVGGERGLAVVDLDLSLVDEGTIRPDGVGF